MSNLFSIFDPNTGMLNLNLNWLVMYLYIIFIPNIYWLTKNQSSMMLTKTMNFLHLEFKLLMGKLSSPGLTWILISMLVQIMMINFMGLMPYIFTSSSHLIFTFSMVLPLWLSFTLLSLFTQLDFTLIHLVPMNTPYVLIPFMVILELLSNLIRPITLAVRLAANMVAGHLLITLMTSQMIYMNMLVFPLVLSVFLLLIILEIAVALIQSYVFSMLMTLYISDINSMNFNMIN